MGAGWSDVPEAVNRVLSVAMFIFVEMCDCLVRCGGGEGEGEAIEVPVTLS